MKTSLLAKVTKYTAIGMAAICGASMAESCNDGSSIGESIVSDEVSVIIDSSFTVTGKSYYADSVLSRTVTQLLGAIDAPGYGYLASDVVTQFMPALKLDTANVTYDSLKLVMNLNIGEWIGDSIVPMGIDIYELNKPLPSPIYSNFNPKGYFNPKPVGSTIYSMTTLGEPDSIKKLGYRRIEVKLEDRIGKYLYDQYRRNPSNFATPSAFSKIFNGLYIKNSYGSGRITRVAQTVMQMYYHTTSPIAGTDRDTTIYNVGNYFAVTPEIITNNNIDLKISSDVRNMVSNGNAIVLAPAGLEVELNFPAREIIDSYRNNVKHLGVINSLSLSIPVVDIENKYNIAPPQSLLLVLKSKRNEFFLKNDINDDKTSFYANYNSTTKKYSFAGLRQYILDLMEKDVITDDDVTFVIVPVNISTETTGSSYYSSGTTYITAISPYVSQPAMAKLDLEHAKINFVYSKQTLVE